MSDFTAYRRVQSPRVNRRCENGCGNYIGHNAVRVNGICHDACGRAFLTLWTCMDCHKDRCRALAEKAERDGVKEPWMHGELARALSALLPLDHPAR